MVARSTQRLSRTACAITEVAALFLTLFVAGEQTSQQFIAPVMVRDRPANEGA